MGTKSRVTFGNRKRWTPLFLQNIETNAAIAVDVWMVYSRGKVHLNMAS